MLNADDRRWFAERAANSEQSIWFQDVGAPLELSALERVAVAQFIFRCFDGEADRASLPSSVLLDEAPRIVFVSASDGESQARTVLGTGFGLCSALEAALRDFHGPRPQWVKMDLVQKAVAAKHVQANLQHDWFGLAFAADRHLACTPEQFALFSAAARRRAAALLQDVSIEKFKLLTSSFFADGQYIVPLYRGHAWFLEYSADSLFQSAVAAGDYLKRAVRPNGKFDYVYRAHADSCKSDYNILRHAGTIYAMLELYETTGDNELLAAASRAIRYLLRRTKSLGNKRCVVESAEVKLGGNSLAILALAKFTQVTGNNEHLRAAVRLARWIRHMQASDGRFIAHKQSFPKGEISDFTSEYYVGQAIFALLMLYRCDPRKAWVDVAEAATLDLIERRDANVRDEHLILDHWLLYGLAELHRLRPRALYLQHIDRLIREAVARQRRKTKYPDWVGGYDDPPQATRTACKSEGLCAIYPIVKDFGTLEQQKTVLECIGLAVRFQLRLQINPALAMLLPNPRRALGAFRNRFSKFDVRIDFVQHNISSLLGAYRIARELGSQSVRARN